MKNFDEIIDNFIVEANDDYLGLWGIAWVFRNYLGIKSDSEVKEKTFQVIPKLMEHNILPGNLGINGGFKFWIGSPSELMARVKSEWPKKGIPELDYSACWFALKRSSDIKKAEVDPQKHEEFMRWAMKVREKTKKNIQYEFKS